MTEILILGVVIVTQTVMMWHMQDRFAKEREQLYNRIQSKDLPEYVAMTAPPTKTREAKEPLLEQL
jgi:hypothetical protein